jgi:hypothetical protein
MHFDKDLRMQYLIIFFHEHNILLKSQSTIGEILNNIETAAICF